MRTRRRWFNWTSGHKRLLWGNHDRHPRLQRPPEAGQRDAGQALLLYSSRTIDRILYRAELDRLAAAPDAATIVHTLTRNAPSGWTGERGRIDRAMLARRGIAAIEEPDIFVCGPTPFVEAVADQLLAIGHAEARIRTERFGPTGDTP